VSPAANFCVDGLLTDRLETAESRVPGTAGFVARYLRIVPAPAEGQDAELRAMAERLSAGQRDEWAAIWRGVDAHRRPDGTFTPWAYRTVREYLELRRAESQTSNRWMDRITGALLLPSLVIVRVAGG